MFLLLQILYPLGLFIVYFGVFMLLPAIFALVMNDNLSTVYLTAAAFVMAVGGIAVYFGKLFFSSNLQVRHGFLLVTLMWTITPLFGALPLFYAIQNLPFVDAYFEAASGLTASGATILSGLDQLPKSVNFWRALMSWAGGMGLVVLATALLPILGIGGSGVFNAELTGPMKEKKILPKLTETAKYLWGIYASLTLICVLCYYVAGMSFFDSVIHGFTTMSLGGFSSHDSSFAHFDSVAIEVVAIIFMTIAGMNFGLHLAAWTHHDIKTYFRNTEWRLYLLLVFFAVSLTILFLLSQQNWAGGDAIRYGTFNAISIITTTGYSNSNYGAWPLFMPLFLLWMANFVACSGSTGGGIKLVRGVIVINQIAVEQQKLVHPMAYYNNKLRSFPLPSKVIISVLFFVMIYVLVIVLLSFFFLFTGLDIVTAISSAMAAISNTGPALGTAGPADNFAHFSPSQKAVFSFAMIAGRLEMLSFLAIISRQFWKF